MYTKQYKDTRTGDIVKTFNIMEIKYMEEVPLCTICYEVPATRSSGVCEKCDKHVLTNIVDKFLIATKQQ